MPNPSDIAHQQADPRRGMMHPEGYWTTFDVQEFTIDLSTVMVPRIEYYDTAGTSYGPTKPATPATVPRRFASHPKVPATPAGVAGQVATDGCVLFGLIRRNPVGYSKGYRDYDNTQYDGQKYWRVGDVFAGSFWAGTPFVLGPNTYSPFECPVLPGVSIPGPQFTLYSFALLVFDGFRPNVPRVTGQIFDPNLATTIQGTYHLEAWEGRAVWGTKKTLVMVPPLGAAGNQYDPCEWTEDGAAFATTAGNYALRAAPNSNTQATDTLGNPARLRGCSNADNLVFRPAAVAAKNAVAVPTASSTPGDGALPYYLPYDGSEYTEDTPGSDPPVPKPGHLMHSVMAGGDWRFWEFKPSGDFVRSRRSVPMPQALRADVYTYTSGAFVESIDLAREDHGYHHPGYLYTFGGQTTYNAFKLNYGRLHELWSGQSGTRRITVVLFDLICPLAAGPFGGSGPPYPATRHTGPSTSPGGAAVPQAQPAGYSLTKYPVYVGSQLRGVAGFSPVNAVGSIDCVTADPIDVAVYAMSETTPAPATRTVRVQKRAGAVPAVATRPAIATAPPWLAGRVAPYFNNYLDAWLQSVPVFGGPVALIPKANAAGRTVLIAGTNGNTGATANYTATTDAEGWWEAPASLGGGYNISYTVTLQTAGTEAANSVTVGSPIATAPAAGCYDNILLWYTA